MECHPKFKSYKDTPDGKYYISLCCTDIEQKSYCETGKSIGIDLGIKEFAVFSNGEHIANPKYYRKYEARLKREQQRLSKRHKDGKNRNKQRIKVSRIHQKIKDCRTDFIHQLTTRLLFENDIICIEDLRISNMLKNHKLAKSISDASWHEFRRQLEYKSRWYNKTISIVDPFYPSSQTCSKCDYKNELVKDLKVRSWTCPNCNKYHKDRDVNSAINIEKEGLKKVNK